MRDRAIGLVALVLLVACQSGYQSTQNRRTAVPRANPSANASKAQTTVIVQPGDTVFGIAFRAGLNYREVAAWNGIDEPYTIQVGQKLRLRPPASFTALRHVPKAPSTRPNQKTVLGKPVAEVAIPSEKSGAPALSDIDWLWPAKGALVGRFIAGDKTSQGINIAGKNGQDIRAAADGTVVYSGSGLIGYGELLIIKHNNEWISAYGHNRKRLVAEGAKVKAGQLIAEMGQSGASHTRLHFEIRHNGQPVDPLLYLPNR